MGKEETQRKKEKKREKKPERKKLKMTVSVVLLTAAFIAELYLMLNQSRQYPLLALIGFLMLCLVYRITDLSFSMQEDKIAEAEQEYEMLFKSEKASYILMKNSFEALKRDMAKTANEPQFSADEMAQLQKSVGKIIIHRGKENADAILNSNDKIMDRILALEDMLQELKTAKESAQQENAETEQLKESGKSEELKQLEKLEQLEQLKQLEKLDELQQLGQLKQLERLEQLEETVQKLEKELLEKQQDNALRLQELERNLERKLKEMLQNLPQRKSAEAQTEPTIKVVSETKVSAEPMTEETMQAELLAEAEEALQTEAETELVSEETMQAELLAEAEEALQAEAETELATEEITQTELLAEAEEALQAKAEPELASEETAQTGESIKGNETSLIEGINLEETRLDDLMNEVEALENRSEKEAISAVESEAEVAPVAEPMPQKVEVTPVSSDPNHVMTPDEIAALFGQVNGETAEAEPESETEPAVEIEVKTAVESEEKAEAMPMVEPTPQKVEVTPISSDPNHVMTPDEIAALFGQVNGETTAETEIESVTEPVMETEVAPAIKSEESKEEAEIKTAVESEEKEVAPAAEPTPQKVEVTPISSDPNHVMTPDEIAALFGQVNGEATAEAEIKTAVEAEEKEVEPAVEPTPQKVEVTPISSDPNHVMTPDEIAALFGQVNGETTVEPKQEVVTEQEAEKPPMPDLSDPNHVMTPEEIAALFANM